MIDLMRVLLPANPPTPPEPALVHTLEHGTMTPRQRRQKEAKSASNLAEYLRMKQKEGR